MPQAKKVIKKICLLGDGAVGKTTLVQKFVAGAFSEQYIRTLGFTASEKTILCETAQGTIELKLTIADIAGQLGHESVDTGLRARYLAGAHGALIVGDLTRPETISHLDAWVGMLYQTSPNASLIFLGNKQDLLDEGQRGTASAGLEAVAARYATDYKLTSALTGLNVEQAFRDIGAKILAQRR